MSARAFRARIEAFRSFEVYNHMLPGWIVSVKGYFISNKFIVPGKARVIDALIPVWIITEKEGSIISAHCVDSKASLGETFFHTASVLLFVRVDENSPKSKNWRLHSSHLPVDLNLPSFCIKGRSSTLECVT